MDLIEKRVVVCTVVKVRFLCRNPRLTSSPRRSVICLTVVLVRGLSNPAVHSYLSFSLIVPLRSCLSTSTFMTSPVR